MPRVGFLDTLKAEFRLDGTVKILEDLVYRSKDHGVFVAPAGFVCDLASVPKILPGFIRIWLGGPIDTAAPAVLHDWLYRTGVVSRSIADALFYEALRSTDETLVGGWIQWLGVRSVGWLFWREHRNKESRNAPSGEQGEEGS